MFVLQSLLACLCCRLCYNGCRHAHAHCNSS